MENMSASVTSSVSTTEFPEIRFPVYINVTNVVIGTLTLLCNGTLVTCMFHRREKFSTVLWYQIVCLGLSDMLAGIAPLLIFLTSVSSINLNPTACKFIIVLFHICQLATLLNLSHLSARRLYVVGFKRTQFRNSCSSIVLVGLSGLSWLVSCALLLPFLSLMTSRETVNGCLSPMMFDDEENLIVAFRYSVIIQCIPVVFLNISYVAVIVIMRVQSRRPQIHPQVSNDDGRTEAFQLTRAHIFQIRTLFYPNDHQTAVAAQGPRQTRQVRTNIKQLTALRHLLIVLVVVNCTTWPYFIVNYLASSGVIAFDTPIIDLQILCLNSLLNPLIYAISIRDVRLALKDTATRLAAAVNCFHR